MRSMFKFPEGSEVHIQCDIVPCMITGCAEMESCVGQASLFNKGGKALGQMEDGLLLGATTVFVLDPADAPCKLDYLVLRSVECISCCSNFKENYNQ